MGNETSHATKAHQDVEKKMKLQIIVPKPLLDPPVDLLDMGIFENGQFIKVSNLSAKMYCNEKDEREMKKEEQYLDTKLSEESLSSDGSHCRLVVNGYTVEQCDLLLLKKIMAEPTQISEDFFKRQGFKNGIIYIVYKVCKSPHFSINEELFSVSKNKNEMKVWGYNIAKFKLRRGAFKFIGTV